MVVSPARDPSVVNIEYEYVYHERRGYEYEYEQHVRRGYEYEYVQHERRWYEYDSAVL